MLEDDELMKLLLLLPWFTVSRHLLLNAGDGERMRWRLSLQWRGGRRPRVLAASKIIYTDNWYTFQRFLKRGACLQAVGGLLSRVIR